mmetsp:Transcript_26036/g.41878  ORF Transcript_26036/g.41878 Transcript_26036/m.41878 type:complete len:214 (-) Transcript_26036:288-929(-)
MRPPWHASRKSGNGKRGAKKKHSRRRTKLPDRQRRRKMRRHSWNLVARNCSRWRRSKKRPPRSGQRRKSADPRSWKPSRNSYDKSEARLSARSRSKRLSLLPRRQRVLKSPVLWMMSRRVYILRCKNCRIAKQHLRLSAPSRWRSSEQNRRKSKVGVLRWSARRPRQRCSGARKRKICVSKSTRCNAESQASTRIKRRSWRRSGSWQSCKPAS